MLSIKLVTKFRKISHLKLNILQCICIWILSTIYTILSPTLACKHYHNKQCITTKNRQTITWHDLSVSVAITQVAHNGTWFVPTLVQAPWRSREQYQELLPPVSGGSRKPWKNGRGTNSLRCNVEFTGRNWFVLVWTGFRNLCIKKWKNNQFPSKIDGF